MLKTNKGITLISLIIYIVITIVVITMLASMLAYFSKDVKDITGGNLEVMELDRFYTYFLKDVKATNSGISSLTTTSIIFTSGNKYEYKQNAIYLNDKIKIAGDIENCTFTQSTSDGNTIITTNISINENTYTQQFVLSNRINLAQTINESDYVHIVSKLPNGSWDGTIHTPKIAGTGLTAVYWNDTEWVELTEESSSEDWAKYYDYDNQKWANAKSADGSMWVWIPRYEYKINTSNKTIDIRFIATAIKKGATGYTENAAGILTSSDGYIIHPAFMDDSENEYNNGGWDSELPGFWVAKYEAGFQTGTKDTVQKSTTNKYTTVNTDSSYQKNYLGTISTADYLSYPVFVAAANSYNLISIADAFVLAQEIDTASMYGLSNVDSHLLKNSEWGAVAYLARSKSGLNGGELTVNSYNANNTTNNIYAKTGYGGTTLNNTAASTTSNMTGVFDMSGGLWERTTGYYKTGAASTPGYHSLMATSATIASTEYLTLYTSNNKKGDAMNETSGWDSDYANFVGSSTPVCIHGGRFNSGVKAGLFSFDYSSGIPVYHSGFRVCLVP